MSEGVYGEQATGRVTHSLLRLSTAMRSQAWEWAEGAGLTPTQGEILVLLMQRKGPMRLGEIARETALTAATTSDAVSTLETKGLVEKRRALDDGRALAVRLTARGRTAAKRAAQWPDFLAKAVGTLRDDEQAVFYRTLLKTVHQLEAQHALRAEQEPEEDAASLRVARSEHVGYGSAPRLLGVRDGRRRHPEEDLEDLRPVRRLLPGQSATLPSRLRQAAYAACQPTGAAWRQVFSQPEGGAGR
jgi:DNA-binding MarR family transcriptional regulator